MWVNKQGSFHNKNKLQLDRKKFLDEIDFVWKVDGWYQQYEQLVEFKRKDGDCRVPSKYEHDKYLGQWVAKQRSFHTKNEIRLDRKDLLDAIGFAWKVDTDLAVWKADKIAAHLPGEDKRWHQQCEKLVEFKMKHGHCMVPRRNKEDRSI
jgi:hypothetical protein